VNTRAFSLVEVLVVLVMVGVVFTVLVGVNLSSLSTTRASRELRAATDTVRVTVEELRARRDELPGVCADRTADTDVGRLDVVCRVTPCTALLSCAAGTTPDLYRVDLTVRRGARTLHTARTVIAP
jgi:prepilin-type N-terminal cleavage/methylation domain-containing protein